MRGVTSYAADLSSIRDAQERIRQGVHLTPVLRSSALDQMASRELFFKCENFQKVGAFKMRGALNAILSLPPEVRKKGVVTHSSGNFAQAVALSAREAGIEARIVMPNNAPRVKVDAVRGYGGKVVFCEPTLVARESTAALEVEDSGGTLLHPFDQDEVIAGQGTVGLELVDQIPNLDAVVVPVGGGGLISGIALALSEINPSIRIFGAEPAGADDAARSKAAGRWILQEAPNTVADGLLTSLGERTWPVIRDKVESISVVDDDAILASMRLIWERMKIVVEPSAAIALAAVLQEPLFVEPGIQRVAVVLSGGNVDLDRSFG
jgi:threonine dehydratase